MSENRPSDIAILDIESELACSIEYDELVDTFAKLPTLRDCCTAISEGHARKLPLLLGFRIYY